MNIHNKEIAWSVSNKSFSFIRWYINYRPYTIYPYGDRKKSLFKPDFHFRDNKITFNRNTNWFTL